MKTTTTTTYEQMGIASLLPGMTYAIELVQRQLDEMRAQLAGIMSGSTPTVKRGVGRPKGKSNGSNTYWSRLTPAERTAEMKHRTDVRLGRAEPRDKRATKATTKTLTDSARKKVSSYQKQLWASYTPAQRKKRTEAALAGRLRAAKVKHVNGAAA